MKVVRQTVSDVTRRKQNVILSGIVEGSSDEESLRILCENHLYMKLPTKQYVTKRLGVSRLDGLPRPRRLLVLLQSESTVTDLLSRAKILRESADEYVANNVFFINRDFHL